MITDIELLEKIDKKVFQYFGRALSISKSFRKENETSLSVETIARMLQVEEDKMESK